MVGVSLQLKKKSHGLDTDVSPAEGKEEWRSASGHARRSARSRHASVWICTGVEKLPNQLSGRSRCHGSVKDRASLHL